MPWPHVAQQLYMWPFNVTPTWRYSNITQLKPNVYQNLSNRRQYSGGQPRRERGAILVAFALVKYTWHTVFTYFVKYVFWSISCHTINAFRSSEVRAPNQCSGRPWIRVPTGNRSLLFVSRSYHFFSFFSSLKFNLQNIAWGSMCSPGLIVLCSVGSCLWCGGKDDIWKRKKCEWFWMD